jgi:triphosphoribosyl-dephospho-CoA synthetase
MAQAAIRAAEEDQAAADQEAMNAWEAGEMSDKEWLAYAKQRLAESTDEEDKTAWREAIRNSNEQITVRRIESGAEDIINKIEAGTATWQDLRNFYMRERAKINEGSEMYRELTGQIDEVNDTIRDNATEGAIGRAQYLFQSGQINGSEAAAMIRKAAERYKTSDPGRYYQLLSSAYDLQTYGAGGGSGGGSGGGGGGASLADTIDSMEYTADAIDLLNDQFNNGKRIGTLPDGTEVPLGDESGNPTATWREIDRMMVETLDAQYEAKVANGDRDAGEVMQRKEAYITNSVQPRNTIPEQAQFNSLQRDLGRAVASQDPKQIQQVLASMERWASRLNTTTTSTDVEKRASDAKVRENPELAAAARRQTTKEADELLQTTRDGYNSDGEVVQGFDSQVRATLAAYRAAFENPNLTAEQAAQIMSGAEGADQSVMAGLQEISTKTNGLADGSFVRVMYQDGTMDAVPVISTSVPGPDGNPIRDLRPDIDFDGDSQGVAQVLREVNGRPELVWAVGDYRDVNGERMLMISDERGRMFAKSDESPAWVAADGTETPLPFFGASKSNAQRWVNTNPEAAAALLQSNGVDPTTVDMSRLFYRSDRLVESREDEVNRDYAFQQAIPRVARGERSDWGIEAGRPRGMPAPGSTLGQPTAGFASDPKARGFAGQIGNIGAGNEQRGALLARAAGERVGIKFEVQDRKSGLTRKMPQVSRVNVRTPNVTAPKIRAVNVRPVAPLRLPDFSNLRARTSAIQRQIAGFRANSETGFI